MPATATDTLQPWADHDDSFEDAICIAEREEGRHLCDAVDDIRSFLEQDLRNHTFASTKELDKAEFIFNALVKEVHKRFYAYSAKLCYIEATHGHP